MVSSEAFCRAKVRISVQNTKFFNAFSTPQPAKSKNIWQNIWLFSTFALSLQPTTGKEKYTAMSIRERIFSVVSPHSETIISRTYDYTMLIAIGISIFPLMFRGHHNLFWLMDTAIIPWVLDQSSLRESCKLVLSYT